MCKHCIFRTNITELYHRFISWGACRLQFDPSALNLLHTQHWAAGRVRQGARCQQEKEPSLYTHLLFNLKIFCFTRALLFERPRTIKGKKMRPRKNSNSTTHPTPTCAWPRKPPVWPQHLSPDCQPPSPQSENQPYENQLERCPAVLIEESKLITSLDKCGIWNQNNDDFFS